MRADYYEIGTVPLPEYSAGTPALVLVIGFAGSTLGMLTWAHYADSDASTANPVQADSLNLNLDGQESLSGTFSITNGLPDSAANHTYSVTNVGVVSADHVQVAVSYSQNDSATEPADPDLQNDLNATETASLVEVTTLEYRNDTGSVLYNATANMDDLNGNGVLDLDDVNRQEGQLDDLAAPQSGGANETRLALGVEIVNDDDGTFIKEGNTAGNLTGYDEDIMADGVDVTITVTLNQDASQ